LRLWFPETGVRMSNETAAPAPGSYGMCWQKLCAASSWASGLEWL